MARESSAIIGSGTAPYTRQILPATQRGVNDSAEGVRQGTQVMLANPEDLNSVDAFVVSGVSIGSTPVKIWGPNINPLPRQRTVILHCDGPDGIYFGNSATSVIAPSGMHLHFAAGGGAGALQQIELPFMHNVEIWARSTGTSQIRILAY